MILVIVVSILLTSGTTGWLYQQMQQVFRQKVEERLLTIATVASTQFSPEELDLIGGPESVGTPAYERTVLALRRIRERTPDVRFLYILRRTDDPDTMEFVADADSLTPHIPIDLNNDGVIDEADALAIPGDPYDVSELPEFRDAAFERPYVDPEFIEDQWGTLVGGTSPILAPDGEGGATDYVIGVDLIITQYQRLLQRIFVPFVAFIVLLLSLILAQALALGRLWQRQVRQLQEIDRQKDELLSIVSHQLGGPITSLRWSLEAVRDGDVGPLSPQQQDEIAQMLRTSNTLADLVATLLDLSRIELGRLAVNRSEVELDPFFDDMLQVIGILAKEKGVTLDVDRPKKLPTASIDPRLTRMTLENLLNNAVKYTPAGGKVTLTVKLRGGRLTCRVRDTGCGIPQEELPQLFSKLFRASNVRDAIPGNGFGLYIAKGAVEQQGGTIRCESRIGRGTTFEVELPLTGEAP